MQNIKKIYLYLVSVIALVIAVVGAIMLFNMALKTWIFTKADQDYYPVDYYRCSANQPNDAMKPAVTADESKCTDEEMAKLKQEANDRRAAQKQRDAAQALAMLVVASPIWYAHWNWARKEV